MKILLLESELLKRTALRLMELKFLPCVENRLSL